MKELHIAAFGDSLTYGYLVKQGYVEFLTHMVKREQPQFDWHIYNYGVNGDTVGEGLRRIEKILAHDVLHCIIIEFGINDYFCGVSTQEYQSQLDRLINTLHDKFSAVAIVLIEPISTLLSVDAQLDPYRLTVKAMEQPPFISSLQISLQKGNQELWMEDGVHLTETGYYEMSKQVSRHIINILC